MRILQSKLIAISAFIVPHIFAKDKIEVIVAEVKEGGGLHGEGQPKNGLYGDLWKGMVSCPKGQYIVGMSARVETPTQGGTDNTALNGVKIKCGSQQGYPGTLSTNNFGYNQEDQLLTVFEGKWGDWTTMKTCEEGLSYDKLKRKLRSHVDQLSVRFESYSFNA